MLILPSLGILFPLLLVAADNDIFWVDDDNTEGPWNGTEQNPYQTIQDGINASAGDNWDIVRVQEGDYYETLTIMKNELTIQGWSSYVNVYPPNPVNNHMLYVQANDVTIDFIHFWGDSTTTIWDGIRAQSSARVTIKDCYVEYCRWGIAISNCEDANVNWSSCWYNDMAGIYVTNSEDTVIENCTSRENEPVESGTADGITISDSVRTKVYQCRIKNNHYIGIYMFRSSGSEDGIQGDYSISYNDIENNDRGVYLVDADDNDIIHNDITDNTDHGVEIDSDSSGCNVIYNNFEDNCEEYMSYEAQGDDDYGNTWDDNIDTGNYWADWASNPGYDDTYELAGTASEEDDYPSAEFDHTVGPQ